VRKYLILLIAIVVLGGAGYVCITQYSYVFTKTIKGEIVKVERVNQNQTIIANGASVPASQLYSFAVAIRDEKGEIHTASGEDRQWAVAQPGQCVVARFSPYPPWNLQKADTFFDARLIQLLDCPKK